MNQKPRITAERLREILTYSEESGLFFWRKASRGKKDISKPAGYLNGAGYVVINPDYLGPLLAHRLAWIYMHGSEPSEMLDHINGDRSDNRIENLRLANNFVNQQNRNSCNKNNKLRTLGVSAHQGGFRARVMFNRKIHDLGVFESPELASAAYAEKKSQLKAGASV